MRRLRICLTVCALLCMLCACGAKKPSASLLTVYFMDVGQGDCTLLRTSDGDVLIDAGTEDGEEVLCDRFREIGVQSLRLAVFTHPDEDHIGGADAVLRRYPAEEVWINGTSESGSESYERLCTVLNENPSAVKVCRAGDYCHLENLMITVLSPFPDDPAESGNDSSLVLRVQCKEIGLLFTGDAETETEENLLASYGKAQLTADVLHAGHHGSDTSTGAAFLSAVSPDYTVISCGAGNRYGHPNALLLERLRNCGTEILRTDLAGTVRMDTDGVTVRFSQMNGSEFFTGKKEE